MATTSKSKDGRAARKRYWDSRRLANKKIANLVKHCGMTLKQATKVWHEGLKIAHTKGPLKGTTSLWGKRQGRVPDGYLRG